MTIWRISCSYDGNNFYQELKKRKVLAQGWPFSGNLSWLFYSERHPDLLNNLGIPINNEPLEDWIPIFADNDKKAFNAFKRLLKEIQSGDLIVGFSGNQPVGICEIPNNFVYFYEDRSDYENVEFKNCLFPVNWIGSCGDLPLEDWFSAGQGIQGIEKANKFHGIDEEGIQDSWDQYKKNNQISIFPKECNEMHVTINNNKESTIIENYSQRLS